MQSHISADFLKEQVLSIHFPKWFYEKVKITESCWLWTGSKTKSGYGQLKRGIGLGLVLAHRASWILHFGEIPKGLHVLHDCPDGDNPACVNPAHLWVGTHKDNIADAKTKGRYKGWKRANGSANGMSKLSESQITEIRRLYFMPRYTLKKLGKMYGVSFGCIGNVVQKKTWAHYQDITDADWCI